MADKIEFRYFVLPEYEEEEEYLCDMAKKGYLFEKAQSSISLEDRILKFIGEKLLC